MTRRKFSKTLSVSSHVFFEIKRPQDSRSQVSKWFSVNCTAMQDCQRKALGSCQATVTQRLMMVGTCVRVIRCVRVTESMGVVSLGDEGVSVAVLVAMPRETEEEKNNGEKTDLSVPCNILIPKTLEDTAQLTPLIYAHRSLWCHRFLHENLRAVPASSHGGANLNGEEEAARAAHLRLNGKEDLEALIGSDQSVHPSY
ncbi:unnamed protein product [Pleuronectes platessa]|uniref:Uncharacterized protein n=1 Tax=Pleuronectes platessa TaxID=8262 RepID=A0A9N7Z7U5_PLEPL|nr:unnamed protein product [Pleuronectes platessa]